MVKVLGNVGMGCGRAGRGPGEYARRKGGRAVSDALQGAARTLWLPGAEATCVRGACIAVYSRRKVASYMELTPVRLRRTSYCRIVKAHGQNFARHGPLRLVCDCIGLGYCLRSHGACF